MSRVEYEPPATTCTKVEMHFVVGQDPQGVWLAVETHNLSGGLFKSRQDALDFVDFETGHRAGAVEFATAPLQLKF